MQLTSSSFTKLAAIFFSFFHVIFFKAMTGTDMPPFIDTLKTNSTFFIQAIDNNEDNQTVKKHLDTFIKQFSYLKNKDYQNKEWQTAYYTFLTNDLLIPFVHTIQRKLLPIDTDLFYLASFITHPGDRLNYYKRLTQELNKESSYILLKNNYRFAYHLIQENDPIPLGYAVVEPIHKKETQKQTKISIEKLIAPTVPVKTNVEFFEKKPTIHPKPFELKEHPKKQNLSVFTFLYEIVKNYIASLKNTLTTFRYHK